jgi:hypothetical protein
MAQRNGWAILDKRRQYINVLYPTEAAALREMEDLLRYFPPDHEWRKRLHIKFVGDEVLAHDYEAPYGHMLVSGDRYGLHLVECATEQSIIRTVLKLQKTGMKPHQIAQRLNTSGRSPRHGTHFTTRMDKDLLDQTRRRHDGKERTVERTAGEATEGCGGGQTASIQ